MTLGKETEISWTDATFNPWWGCVKVSPGCQNCYALTLSKRFGHDIWGPAKTTSRRLFGSKHWAEPLKWNDDAAKAGQRKRVFCASMADVYEDHPQVQDARSQLFNLIVKTAHLDWLLLTKRPENIVRMGPMAWRFTPPDNVWFGTSVENQEQADRRIPELLNVPAKVRFLSCEPLLGPVNIEPYLCICGACFRGEPCGAGVNWVIVGGESGPGARPMHPNWVRSLRDQCVAAGVAYHFKQWGQFAPANGDARTKIGVEYGGMDDPDGRTPIALPDGTITDMGWNGGPGAHLRGGVQLLSLGKKASGRLLDGREWSESPL